MKKLTTSLIVAWAIMLNGSPTQAVPIEFSPTSMDALFGNLTTVAIQISGLVDMAAPSLGTFDFNVNFDPALLALTSVAYGDPLVGDQLNLLGLGSITATTPALGSVS